MQEPVWASELKKKVCRKYNVETPRVQWLRLKAPDTLDFRGITFPTNQKKISGKRYPITITTNPQSNLEENRFVLLHELTHWIDCRKRIGKKEIHGIAFYLLLWRILRENDCDLLYAKREEFLYYPRTAKRAYYMIFKQQL